MKIEIVIPPRHGLGTGNSRTARQWVGVFDAMGHEVAVSEGGDRFEGGLLVVLHGVKCRPALVAYREAKPKGKVVLCLTGTDLYGEHGADLLASMAEADRLVVLQKLGLERVPEEFREKTRVIVQGARRMFRGSGEKRCQVCVVGHLREVKDPLRAAKAARLLPEGSKIEVVQVGAILDGKFGELVEREMKENSRYRWVGELSGEDGRKVIAQSRALVISSVMEGGARVLGEAAVEGTPILSSRIDGVVGLLGEDYPGYFEVGDTEGLATLLERVETDEGFVEELRAGVLAAAGQFGMEREAVAWRSLLEELV